MKKTKVGRNFDELAWLTVLAFETTYGLEIKKDLEDRLIEKLSDDSIQTALKRMERKKIFRLWICENNNEDSSKRKRSCSTTSYADKVLSGIKEIHPGCGSRSRWHLGHLPTK